MSRQRSSSRVTEVIRTHPRSAALALELGATAAVVGLIWVLTATFSSRWVPPLSSILSSFRQTWLFSHVASDLVPSLERLGAGYGMGVVVGVLVGLLFGSSKAVRLLFGPVTMFFRSLPPIVLIPIVILLFGVSEIEKMAIIAFMCVWPVLLNVEDGTAELDVTVRDSARAYHIAGCRYFLQILLPAILPRIFAGMRTALSFAVLLLVIAELFNTTNGVGYQILVDADSYQMTRMWAGVLMLGILGYTLNGVLNIVERRTIKWHYARRAAV